MAHKKGLTATRIPERLCRFSGRRPSHGKKRGKSLQARKAEMTRQNTNTTDRPSQEAKEQGTQETRTPLDQAFVGEVENVWAPAVRGTASGVSIGLVWGLFGKRLQKNSSLPKGNVDEQLFFVLVHNDVSPLSRPSRSRCQNDRCFQRTQCFSIDSCCPRCQCRSYPFKKRKRSIASVIVQWPSTAAEALERPKLSSLRFKMYLHQESTRITS